MVHPSPYKLDVQGHRGARGLLPENTLPGFARALEIGVTTLELDCGVTRDGVVVVSHDRALNPDITRDEHGRWLDASGPAIWHVSYDELQRYDVGRIKPGSAYEKRFPLQEAIDGTRVPRLADLFAFVSRAGNRSVRFNIETKISPLAPEDTAAPDAFVRELLQVISEAGMDSRVTIQSFDWRTLRIVQNDAPAIATVYLTSERTSPDTVQRSASSSPWSAGFHVSRFGGSVPATVSAAGGAVWSPYHGDLAIEDVCEAHDLGLKVVVWTINAVTDMRRLIDWNVDGIISDYPDILRELASRLGC